MKLWLENENELCDLSFEHWDIDRRREMQSLSKFVKSYSSHAKAKNTRSFKPTHSERDILFGTEFPTSQRSFRRVNLFNDLIRLNV